MDKLSYRIIVFVISTSIVICISSCSSYGKASGYVFDRLTRQPLQDVEVSIKGTTIKTFTDASGMYALNDIVPGSQTIVYYKQGYCTSEVSDLTIGKRVKVPIQDLYLMYSPPRAGIYVVNSTIQNATVTPVRPKAGFFSKLFGKNSKAQPIITENESTSLSVAYHQMESSLATTMNSDKVYYLNRHGAIRIENTNIGFLVNAQQIKPEGKIQILTARHYEPSIQGFGIWNYMEEERVITSSPHTESTLEAFHNNIFYVTANLPIGIYALWIPNRYGVEDWYYFFQVGDRNSSPISKTNSATLIDTSKAY